MKRFFAFAGTLFLLQNLLCAAGDSPLLFDVQTEKRIQGIYLIGENEDFILITNKSRIYVYNANSGKLIWEDKVPNYTDEGIELIWNENRYIVSMKKGMRCYDVANGKVLWETKTDFKMSAYNKYFNFKTGFVLSFGNVLMGFNPNTGEIKWQSDGLDWNGDLYKEDISTIWSVEQEYGGRLLVLGDKVTQLIDAETGKMLGKVEINYNPKNPDPVSFIGDNAVALFGKDWTKSLDLRSGKELWAVEEEVNPKKGYLTFEHQGGHYALFGFAKTMMLLNLDKGERMWETGEEIAVNIDAMHLYDDGTLLAVGTKNRFKPMTLAGTNAWAVGLDFATGKMKYKTVIGANKLTSQKTRIPIIGLNIDNRSAVVHAIFDYPNGTLFYFFAQKPRMIGTDGEPGEAGVCEGVILMDPKTGVVKYRTNLTLYDVWEDDLNKANDKGPQVTPFPGNYDDLGETPELKIIGDYGYLNANNTIVKVELSTGKTIWSGPELGFVSYFTVDKGRVFGELGYSRWTYSYDLKGPKADDVVYKSKRNGYFILDEATGKEVWKIDDLKTPLDLFLNEYYPDKGILLLCDGQSLKCLDIQKGSYRWELDLKKQLMGAITADEGVAFILQAVSKEFYSGYNYYSVTTTKTYDISFEHGVFPQPDGNLLVIGSMGPALVNMEGKIMWKTEWDWNPKKINFVPHITEKGIVYQYKKNLTYISLKDGKNIWEVKADKAKDAEIFLDTNSKRLFLIEDNNNIRAYKL